VLPTEEIQASSGENTEQRKELVDPDLVVASSADTDLPFNPPTQDGATRINLQDIPDLLLPTRGDSAFPCARDPYVLNLEPVDVDVEMGKTQSPPLIAPADANRRTSKYPVKQSQQQQGTEEKDKQGQNSARATISSHQQAPSYPQQHGKPAARRREIRSDLSKTSPRAIRRTLPDQEIISDRGDKRARQPGAYAVDKTPLQSVSKSSGQPLKQLSGPQLHPSSPGAHPSFGGGQDSGKGVSDRGHQGASQPGAVIRFFDASRQSDPILETSVFDPQFCTIADSGDTRSARVSGEGTGKVGTIADEGDAGATAFRALRQRQLESSEEENFDDDDDSQELPGAFAITSTREDRRVKGALTQSQRWAQNSLISSEPSKIESFASKSHTTPTLGFVPEVLNQPPPLDALIVKSSRFRSRWCILLVMILLVAVIAVPLSLQAPSPTTAPTVPPTASPTAPPTSRERLDEFIVLLERISERELLEDSTSPQGKAARWLANIDSARVDIKSPRLEERYLGTLFYFSTNSGRNDYLSNESVCDWNDAKTLDPKGIFCNNGNIANISLRKLLEISCLEFCCIRCFLTSASPIAGSDLEGQIPSEIFLLPSLRFLNLRKFLSFFSMLTKDCRMAHSLSLLCSRWQRIKRNFALRNWQLHKS
jgi:hypothetical protein